MVMNSLRSVLSGTAFLIVVLVAASLTAHLCPGQTAVNPADQFTGKIVFHQKDGPTVYDVTLTDGRVSGHEFLGSDPEPIADIVGGWFDHQKGRLSLLIQVTANRVDDRWRSQAQHFKVDPKTKEVTLEHMLYDYGTTLDNAQENLVTAHILDTFDVSVRPMN